MKQFDRNLVLAILVALLSVLFVVKGVEQLSHSIHPMPDEVSFLERAAHQAYFASAPINALILIPLGYVFAAFCGALIGGMLSKTRHRIIFFVVAIFTLLAAVMYMMLYQCPWYFWVLSIFIFPGALLGVRIKPKRVGVRRRG